MQKDPYQILGVGKDAPQEEIAKAYRSLATKFHPDKNPQNPSDAAEKFKEISAAFEIIEEGTTTSTVPEFPVSVLDPGIQ